MQRVLSTDLWSELRKFARVAKDRHAAVAYVTKDHLGFKSGDSLIVDASRYAIVNGETSARLLRTLKNRGVDVFHCESLHAKVFLLGGVAAVGSGNMSKSSQTLVESAVISDQISIVSGVSSFLKQLRDQSQKLTRPQIAELCKIKVIRRGGRGGGRPVLKKQLKRLGSSTWIAGVYELVRDPSAEEQGKIDKDLAEIKSRLGKQLDEQWLRWTGQGGIVKGCKTGDSLIQIWRPRFSSKKAQWVLRAVPVLLKDTRKPFTHLYPDKPKSKMSWGNFKKLLRTIGFSKKVTRLSCRRLTADEADAIERKWNSIKGRR